MWDVQVLKLGQVEVPVPQVLFLTGFDQWCTLNFYMVVATEGNKVVVVNTGLPDDLTDINKFWEVSFGTPYGQRTQIVREDQERPIEALAAIGISPNDVDHVVVTPMMAYSAAHLTAFPEAVYWLSKKGFVNRVIPDKGVVKVRGGDAPPIANYRAPIDIFIPPDQLHHLLYDAYHRVNFVDEAVIEPGLSIWWAGVHHKGSLAVEIDSTAGTVIASDAFFYYENVENNHYLGVGESYDQAMETYEKVRQRADHIIPMHDPKVLDRYPGGKIQGASRRVGS